MAKAGTGPASDGVVVTAFALMVMAIAGNVIAVRYIARGGDLDPFWAAASRFLVASAIFAAAARVVRAPIPRARALAGAVLATSPLLTFLLALLHRQERFRWESIVGGVVVIAGTAVVFRAGVDKGVPVPSLKGSPRRARPGLLRLI